MNSLAYLLGRKSAPLFLKANWVMKSLAGSESEKIAAERQMGALLAKAYEEQTAADKNNRLDAVAKKLTRCLTSKERRHTFKLDRSEAPNACALPGGFIFVSEPLLDLLAEDVDAIAFVLAHEIAHGIHGDASKRYLSRSAIQGILQFGTRGASRAVEQLLAHLIQQGYSREQEFRADRFAVALTRAAGFDPLGGCRLLQALNAHAPGPSRFAAYFSTHPAVEIRIQRIRTRAVELGVG